MGLIDFQYSPGTQKATQQTELSGPAFTDTDHVHFPDARLSTLPPYAPAVFTSDYVTLLGGLRAQWAAKLTGSFVGTYYFFGTHTRLMVAKNGELFNITPLVTSATATLGSDPLAVTNGSAVMTVSYTAHGLVVGDRIKLSGATNTGGITAATHINKEHIVATVPNANSFTVVLGANASSTASGGGASVQIFKQIAAGNLNQGSASGYGTGLYGEGLYGQGGPAVTAQIFPRIWSFGNFGNEVAMCPGDYGTGDGQKIYIWDGDVTVAPTVLTNAPTNCNWIAVINNSIVALCGRTVKICEGGDGTVWSGPTYYEKTLERVWKLVSCYGIGEKDAVIFTPTDAILLRYVGGGDLWDLSDLYPEGGGDGILSPMSASVLGTTLRWRGARGFYSFDGGSPPKKEVNTQNEDWIITNTNYAQVWKSFAYADTQNEQWIHQFPTGDDNEPGDYVIHNPAGPPEGGHWTLGRMARTSSQRPGFIDSTFLMGNGTSASVAGAVYRHFTMGAVTFDWFAETALAYYDGGDNRFMVDQVIPDSNQSGNVTMQFMTREYPQGSESSSPEYTISASTQWQTVKAAGRLLKTRLSGSAAFVSGAWKMNVKKLGKR